jgi:hypothetical protein
MAATPTPSHRVFPGEVRQVGHIVANLDAAMNEWIAVGVGPWTIIEVTQNAAFRGLVSESHVSIGFAHAGALQVELIEAHGTASSSWHEARDGGRFGPHHLAYWTDAFDQTMEQLDRAQLEIVQAGDGNGMARFIYLAGESSAMLIEVMELTDLSRPFMDGIRELSESWDGSGPTIYR